MNELIHQLFEQQAALAPEKTAIVHGQHSCTYAGLQQLAQQTATAMIQLEPAPGGVAMVLLPKGACLVASMLGAFRAGKIYAPVSWQLGDNTWRKMLKEVGPRIIITVEEERSRLEELLKRMEHQVQHVLTVSDTSPFNYYQWTKDGLQQQPGWTLAPGARFPEIAPDDTAYLFFSSGSTGEPKVIAGIHKSLRHFICWQVKEFEYDAASRVSQVAALTFDASLKDILPPLISGGTLCIPPDNALGNAHVLLQWMSNDQLTVLATVPTVFRALLQEMEQSGRGYFSFPHLKYCLLAGEPLFNKDVYRWQKMMGTGTQLVNLYGTTESTILKSFYRIGQVAGKLSESVSVGKPVPNALLLIIHEENRLCNIGETGDVYIKTPFLTKGYYNDPEATAAIFVPNPLTGKTTDIVYRTGDTGQYLPNGNVLLQGRKDNQIKLRGVRIHLGSIESVVLRHQDVKQVKCLLRTTAAGDDYIACYYVADQSLPETALPAFCRQQLNDFEVPDHFIALPAFPLNRHGKVDAQALPDPLSDIAVPVAVAEETLTPTAAQLKLIWQELFKLEHISGGDSFFKIGGNSLKAIQMGAMLTRRMKVEIGIAGLQQLFVKPTLREFADYIDQLQQQSAPATDTIRPAAPREFYPLSYAQQQIWAACQTAESNRAHNMSQAYLIQGNIQPALLREALTQLMARHEVLRTAFTEQQGVAVQQIHATADLPFYFHDLRGAGSNRELVQKIVNDYAYAEFDLAKPGLLRFVGIMTADDSCVLGITLHHIISDSWSGGILAAEMMECYEQLLQGKSWNKAPLAIQYKDYAVHEQQQLQGAAMEKLKSFWLQHLGDKLPAPAFPTDGERTETRSMTGKRLEFDLSPAVRASLQRLSATHQVSPFVWCLSAFYLLLHKYTAANEVIVGMPVATRHQAGLEQQLGVYVNTVALKSALDNTITLHTYIRQIHALLMQAQEHQQYPFQEVARAYVHQHHPKHNPVFDFAVNMLTSAAPDMPAARSSLRISDWDMGHAFSKFDMTLYVYDELKDDARWFIEYNTTLFSEATIQRFAARYTDMLEKFEKHLDLPLKELLFEKVALPGMQRVKA